MYSARKRAVVSEMSSLVKPRDVPSITPQKVMIAGAGRTLTTT